MGHYAAEMSCPDCKNIRCTCPIDPEVEEFCKKNRDETDKEVAKYINHLKSLKFKR